MELQPFKLSKCKELHSKAFQSHQNLLEKQKCRSLFWFYLLYMDHSATHFATRWTVIPGRSVILLGLQYLNKFGDARELFAAGSGKFKFNFIILRREATSRFCLHVHYKAYPFASQVPIGLVWSIFVYILFMSFW